MSSIDTEGVEAVEDTAWLNKQLVGDLVQSATATPPDASLVAPESISVDATAPPEEPEDPLNPKPKFGGRVKRA